jgi:hypothetical protein
MRWRNGCAALWTRTCCLNAGGKLLMLRRAQDAAYTAGLLRLQ